MLLPIRTLGDPVLREPAKPVESFDRALRRLAKDMIETMYEAPGVGLAGPQVGLSLQLFVFDDGEHGPSFLANPELLRRRRGGRPRRRAACRSPGRTIRRRGRDASVVVGFDVRRASRWSAGADGLLARIFQHETDHLRGTLYIDRLDDDGRSAVLAELRRIELGLVEPRGRRRA